MTAKEYLSQAKYIDNRIASKREQIQNLHDLATKCTSTWLICLEVLIRVVPEWQIV